MKAKIIDMKIKKWSEFLADAAVCKAKVYPMGSQFVYDEGSLPSGMTGIAAGDILNLQRENGLSAQNVPGIAADWVRIDGNPGDNGKVPDEVFLTAVGEAITPKTRSTAASKKGHYVLRPTDDFATVLATYGANYIYEICFDYDLGAATVTIPRGSLLKFNGGSLSNGKLVGNGAAIEAGNVQIFSNVTFDLAEPFSCALNICWVGCVGDWYQGADTYTDNTGYFQAALDSCMPLYIPNGKFGFDGHVTKTLTPYGDTSTFRRNIEIFGEGYMSSWLVALENNSNASFMQITGSGNIVGYMRDFYITTGNSNSMKYGLATYLTTSAFFVDLHIYGKFEWCFYLEGGVQYSGFRLICTRIPEFNIKKDPQNGVYFNSSYVVAGSLYVICENYATYGINVVAASGNGFDVQFMVESNSAYCGTLQLGTCKTYVHDSHHESSYNGDGEKIPLVITGSSNVTFFQNYIAPRIIGSSVVVEKGTIESADDDSYVVMVDSQLRNGIRNNSLESSFKSIVLRGGMKTDSPGNQLNAYPMEMDAANLATNIYDFTASSGNNNNRCRLCGVGCADTTHYEGFNHSVFVQGVNNESISAAYSFDINPIVKSPIVAKLARSKYIAISALIKPVDDYAPMNSLSITLRDSKNQGANRKKTYRSFVGTDGKTYSDWEALEGGWYRVSVFQDITHEDLNDFTSDWKVVFIGLATDGNNTSARASYYLTQVMITDARGATTRHFRCKEGENVNSNIDKLTTARRTALAPLSTDDGLTVYDTDLHQYVLWNGTDWVNLDGTALA